MKKRILSILLTLCMVLMLCPVTAFAANYYTVTQNFKYGTLARIPEAENPHTFTVKEDETFVLTKVENCAPYEFVGWKESVSGTVYEPDELHKSFQAANLTFDAVYQVQGSLAITVDGFEVGNTPADCTYSFESTIPGVTFGKDDIQNVFWGEFVFDGSDYTPNRISNTDVFEADTRYRVVICLNNKGLDTAPAVTVNGKTPEDCLIATRNGVPIQLQIFCTLGTPPEPSQYTVTYDGGEGSDPVTDVKTHGEALTLRGETFTMDGFVQTGWVDKETGAVYKLGGTYSTDADVTLNPVFDEIITLTVPFTTTVKLGGNTAPGETTFDLAIVGANVSEENYADVVVSGSVTTNGAGDYEGTLTLTGPEGQLREMLCEGAFVQQVNAGEEGWTVDDTVYGLLWWNAAELATADTAEGITVLILPVICEEGDDGVYYDLDWNADPLDEMTFTNTYTKNTVPPEDPTPPENPTNTGDNSNSAPWLALLAVSAAGMIGTGVYSKRRRASREK
ncbi:MAG: InlB B-repeat-containing protein [Firmicutes bacterium]|nr:InlB B-repeat-containing protein [Bacillota bacterium]